MVDILLSRIANTREGMFGVLSWYGRPFAVSLEDEWKYNQPNVSCIPAGTYKCNRVKSPKFGDTFEVMYVQGRSHILFHKGNTEDDTEGCILVGEQFGTLFDKTAILSSSAGFKEFKQLTADVDGFSLAIRDYWL